MTEWKKVKLGDVCDVRDGTHDSPKKSKEGYSLVTSKNLKNGQIDLSNTYLISKKDYEDINKRSLVERYDILFSMIGTIGELAIVKNEPNFAIKNVGLFKMNGNNLLSKWVYYYFHSKEAKAEIEASLKGSTQQYISLADLRKFPISLPPLPTQKKIAEVLSCLDAQIELNRRINENLEQQAQAIFKEWFVDNAKPEWKRGKFLDLIESLISGDWGKEQRVGNNTEKVFCIRGADIPNIKTGEKGKLPTRFILPKNYEEKHLVDGDLIIEISGGSPTQSTGRIAAVSEFLLRRFDSKIICTNFCKAIKPKKGYSTFVYYYWQFLYNQNLFFAYENGTTGIKNLDLSGFIESEEIVIPPMPVIEKFDKICQRIFEITYENALENETLAQIRDTLLPKLMNGELVL